MARDNLTKRAGAARSRSLGALNLFRNAAKELEAAAEAHRSVAQTAFAQADELGQLGDEHSDLQRDAKNAAAKLREIVGGE